MTPITRHTPPPAIPGASHLTGPVGRASKGLRQLSFSHCNLTSKGVNHLCHALSLNRTMSSTLTTLELGGNTLKEEVTSLYNFLAQPNAVQSLNVSGCDLLLDSVRGAAEGSVCVYCLGGKGGGLQGGCVCNDRSA